MKRNTTVLLLLLCGFMALHAEVQFPISFGSTGADYGKDIRYDQDGNVYVAGYFQGTVDFDPTDGIHNLTAQGLPTVAAAVDMFVAKYDPDGNLLWVFPISSPGSDMPHSLFVKDNGFLLTGYIGGIADFDPDPSQQFLLNAGSGRDFFIASYTEDGDLEFAVRAGDNEEAPYDTNDDRFEDGMDVCSDDSGNIYATGVYKGTIDLDPTPGSAEYTSTDDSRDIYMLSLDAAGNYRWGFSLGGAGQDHGHGVRIIQVAELPLPEPEISRVDEGFKLSWNSVPHAEAYRIYSSENPNPESWNMIQTTSDTEYEVSGDAEHQFYRITAVFPDFMRSNMAIFTGFFSGTVDFDPSDANYSLTSNGGWDIFLAGYDAGDGSFLWAKRFGGSGFDQARPGGIWVDNQGRILVTGDFTNTVDFDPGQGISSHSSNGSGDIFVGIYNALGEYIDSFAIGGTMSDFAHRITTDSLGNIVITGQFNAPVDFDPSAQQYTLSPNGSAGDVFVAKYTSQGDFLWANSFGGSITGAASYQIGTGVSVNSTDEILITGRYYLNPDVDPSDNQFLLQSNGSCDCFVIKYSPGGNLVYESNVGTEDITADNLLQVSIYPNPFNPSTTMDFNLPEPSSICINIYNVTGQKVKSIREDILPAGNNTISWNGMDDNGKAVSSGMYLFKMQAGKYSSTKKMILMK